MRAPKGPSVPSVIPRPSITKSTPTASEWQYPQPAALPSNVPESRLEVPEVREENPSLAEEGDFCLLFSFPFVYGLTSDIGYSNISCLTLPNVSGFIIAYSFSH